MGTDRRFGELDWRPVRIGLKFVGLGWKFERIGSRPVLPIKFVC